MGRNLLVTLFLLCSCFLNCGSFAITEFSDGEPGSNCTMGGGVVGHCEDLEACLQSGGVVQRSGQVKLCKAQANKIYACCRRPKEIANELCDAWSSFYRGDNKKCLKDHPLIIGGGQADLGEFPHIAGIGAKDRSKIVWGCGGSLLSPHFVLTAAHCVLNNNTEYWVILGEHDRRVTDGEKIPSMRGAGFPSSLYRSEELPRMDTPVTEAPIKQQIPVKEVIRHPHYLRARKYHDLALLRLETPVTLTSRVLPACLQTEELKHLDSNTNLTVAGWGRTDTQISASVLQKATVPMRELLECQVQLASRDRIAAAFGLMGDQLCAGAHGIDSCSGDSGGPLTTQYPQFGSRCEHTLVGVVSFGLGCGGHGIYVRVSQYLDWIMGYVAPNA